MNEEVIIDNMFGNISDMTPEEVEKKRILCNAAIANTMLKSKLNELQNEISKYPTVKEPLLNDFALPGMYVKYDAGRWDRTEDVPSTKFVLPWKQSGFCMFEKGKSKNDSVMDYHGNLSPDGWLVLGVIEDEVYLVHAGIACVYFTNNSIDAGLEIKKMREFCAKEFANSQYAKEALCATKQLFEIVEKAFSGRLPENLTSIGAPFWLATLTNHNTICYYDRSGKRKSKEENERIAYGIRPIVILKHNVKVASGNGTKESPIELTF